MKKIKKGDMTEIMELLKSAIFKSNIDGKLEEEGIKSFRLSGRKMIFNEEYYLLIEGEIGRILERYYKVIGTMDSYYLSRLACIVELMLDGQEEGAAQVAHETSYWAYQDLIENNHDDELWLRAVSSFFDRLSKWATYSSEW